VPTDRQVVIAELAPVFLLDRPHACPMINHGAKR
jgi:hypothetical protein